MRGLYTIVMFTFLIVGCGGESSPLVDNEPSMDAEVGDDGATDVADASSSDAADVDTGGADDTAVDDAITDDVGDDDVEVVQDVADDPRTDSGGPLDRVLPHVVLMTHIEDNRPQGASGTDAHREDYLLVRRILVDFARRMHEEDVQWVLQPDWTMLEAALEYERGALLDSTDGVNAWAYMQDELGVRIDPHSHENRGRNYSDVACLLDRLGVGGSTVIGGHIWDPDDALFQEWDRFRAPVNGQQGPCRDFAWRGDILIGAGTPNHINDRVHTGVWHPASRDAFFDHDPSGNITAIGSWAVMYDVDVEDRPGAFVRDVETLLDLQESGTVSPDTLLTANWNIGLLNLDTPAAMEQVITEAVRPLAEMQAAGEIRVTDFQEIVDVWQRGDTSTSGVYLP